MQICPWDIHEAYLSEFCKESGFFIDIYCQRTDSAEKTGATNLGCDLEDESVMVAFSISRSNYLIIERVSCRD